MQSNAPVQRKDRQFHLDFIRALACLSVVMGHTSAHYMMAEPGTAGYAIGSIFNFLVRASVPLFVMLSGALMLDENYKFTREKIGKHIKKLIFFFLFWSAAYCLIYEVAMPVLKGESLSIGEILWKIFEGHTHLWYVPMMIGLYLLLPLLRLWVTDKNRGYVKYFLILGAVFGLALPQIATLAAAFAPGMERLQAVIANFYMYYPMGYTFYFILGWYLNSATELPGKKIICTLGILGLLGTAGGTTALVALGKEDTYLFFDPLTINILLQAIGIFLLGKSIFAHRSPDSNSRFSKAVCFVSKHSLGVYAVHVIILAALTHVISGLSPYFELPALFVACAALSLAVSAILSRIPILRQFV